MKISLIQFVCAIFLAITNLDAQVIKSFGFGVGAVHATQMHQGSTSEMYRWGFDFGISFELVRTKNFNLIFESRYTQKGYAAIELRPDYNWSGWPSSPVYGRVDHQVDYLSIPVLARFHLESQGITPYMIAGPRVDVYLTNQDTRWNWSYPPLDVGATFGAGVQIPLSQKICISLETRMSPDFTCIHNDASAKVRNSSYEFIVGFAVGSDN